MQQHIITNSYMIGEVDANKDDFWTANTPVNGNACISKLHSGSKVNVIEEKFTWLKGIKLEKTSSEFKGPGGIKLTHLIKGQIAKAKLRFGNRSHI